MNRARTRIAFVIGSAFLIGVGLSTAAAAQTPPPSDPRDSQECWNWSTQEGNRISSSSAVRMRACLSGDSVGASVRCQENSIRIQQREYATRKEQQDACYAAVKAHAEREKVLAEIRRRNEENERAMRESQQRQAQMARQSELQQQQWLAQQRESQQQLAQQRQMQQLQRQQQTNAQIDALGSLVMGMLSRPSAPDRIPHAAPAPAAPSVETGTSLAKTLFVAAQTAFNTNLVVRQIQDFAWNRLKEFQNYGADQLKILDQQVSAILSEAPTAVSALPVDAPRKMVWAWPEFFGDRPVQYAGAVDESGRPHGRGVVESSTDAGLRTVAVGDFRRGVAQGVFTTRTVSDSAPSNEQVVQRFTDNRPVGPMVRVSPANIPGATRVDGPDLQRLAPGERAFARMHFGERTTIEGHFDRHGQPAGLVTIRHPVMTATGEFRRTDMASLEWQSIGQVLTSNTTEGFESRCQEARYVETSTSRSSFICSGMVERSFADGSRQLRYHTRASEYRLASGVHSKHSVLMAVWPKALDNPNQAVSREYLGRAADGADLERLVFGDGMVYEGSTGGWDWAAKEAEAIGVMRSPNGRTRRGTFRGGILVDGTITEPSGDVKTVGNGNAAVANSYMPQSVAVIPAHKRSNAPRVSQGSEPAGLRNLPLDSSIVYRFGEGTRRLFVLLDPTDPHGKLLHRDLKGVQDTSVHVLLHPILSPAAVDLARRVWCSRDRAVALDDLLLRGVEPKPAAADCVDPGQQILQIGRTARVMGSPTMVFSDGTVLPGRLPLDAIERALQAAQPVSPRVPVGSAPLTHQVAAPNTASVQADWVDGEVRRIDVANGRIQLHHDGIRSLDMPPMTFSFRTRDVAQISDLKDGDRVRFQAASEGGNYVLTQIEKRR